MRKLLIALVEASIEPIPDSLARDPRIVAYCRRRGKEVRYTLLDSSYHHAAMKGLKDREKRGRPDIVHFALLELLESPINRRGLVEFLLHTYDGLIVTIDPETRLPRVYERFKGLMEKLLREGSIATKDGKVLMMLRRRDLKSAISELAPSNVFLMTESGSYVSQPELEYIMRREERPLFVIGCFPHGEFGKDVRSLSQNLLSISPNPLPTWIVVSRILCVAERVMA